MMAKMKTSGALVAALLGGAALSVAAPAVAQDVTMSVVTGSPPNHIISKGTENWMSCVSAAAGERVKFNYFPSGQLVALRELQAGLENGVADSVPIPVGYVTDKLPLNGVSMLPGMGTSATQIIGAYSKAVREDEALVKEFAAIDAVPIWVMGFPPYQIISTGPAMRKLEDFKGKVIRSAGGSMTLAINALGAAPAEVVVADLYVSMERGTVDATISGANSVKPYNLQEIMKSMSMNGAFGTFTNAFAIRGAVWEEVPADLQKTMSDCGLQTEQWMANTMDSESGALNDEFKAKGVDMYDFTAEEAATINATLASVVDDWIKRLADRGLPAADLVKRYQGYLATN